MSVAWISSNPKFLVLVRKLKLPAPYVRGLLDTMWDVCHLTADPVLGGVDEIEAAAQWPGEDGVFFKALKAGGWIEEYKPGRWMVHDYWDHCPEFVADRLKKRRQREDKRRKSLECLPPVPGQSRDNPPTVPGKSRDNPPTVPGKSEKIGASPSPSPMIDKKIASSIHGSYSISAHASAILDDKPTESDAIKAEANLLKPQDKAEDEKPKTPLMTRASSLPAGSSSPSRGGFKSMGAVVDKLNLPRSDPSPPRETLDSYLRTVCPGISQEQREMLQRYGLPLTEAYKVISHFNSQTAKKPIGNADGYLWSMLKNAAIAIAKELGTGREGG